MKIEFANAAPNEYRSLGSFPLGTLVAYDEGHGHTDHYIVGALPYSGSGTGNRRIAINLKHGTYRENGSFRAVPGKVVIGE